MGLYSCVCVCGGGGGLIHGWILDVRILVGIYTGGGGGGGSHIRGFTASGIHVFYKHNAYKHTKAEMLS